MYGLPQAGIDYIVVRGLVFDCMVPACVTLYRVCGGHALIPDLFALVAGALKAAGLGFNAALAIYF